MNIIIKLCIMLTLKTATKNCITISNTLKLWQKSL